MTRRHRYNCGLPRLSGSLAECTPGKCLATVVLGILVMWSVVWEMQAQADAGNALRFGASNAHVTVPHHANLNTYPLTVSAWFRTTNGANIVQGIASKYPDGSGNGWALMVVNGRLRGFHYRSLFNWSIDFTATANVADGLWHHAALTVDASGGKLFLDGVQVGSSSWVGAAGSSTTTEPLFIGRYSHSPYPSFFGTIDQVSIWNRALGTNEINYLKHRQLNGNEHGLVALWRLDEGSGTTTADASGNGHNGTLANGPVWINSTAPLVFNQVAGRAVSLNGVNQHVNVPHAADLNAYPLTVTAWIKTSRIAANYDGIVNKYGAGSGNGYSMHLYNGRLYAWYFRGDGVATNRVYNGDPGLDGGLVADGQWHHVAFTVGPTGGRLFVDGVQRTNLAWSGTPGPPSTTVPVLIGQYPGFGSFSGQIDEPTIWNRELTLSEIQTMRHVRLTGTEPNLVGYWRFDEGSGTSAADFTGLGHTGMLMNSAAWTGSTAFLGDGTSAIHTTLGAVQWSRTFAVETIPAQRGFASSAPLRVRRLDDFGAPDGNTLATVSLESALQGTLAGSVPLVNSTTQINISLPPYNAAIPQATAGGMLQTNALNVEPQSGTQLDSVNNTFQLTVAASHTVNGGPSVAAESAMLPFTRLLHFNGHLFFGDIDTIFTNILNAPIALAVSPPTNLTSTVQVANNAGYIAVNPVVTYSGSVNVRLLTNGNAIATSGVTPSYPPLVAGNIQYSFDILTLGPNGAFGNPMVKLPVGMGYATHTNSRVLLTTLEFPYLQPLQLGPDLLPVNSPAVWNAPGTVYFVEETKPLYMGATHVEWHAQEGELRFPVTTMHFVRQTEDDVLAAQRASLAGQPGEDRISNDGYYHNASAVPGSTVSMRADINGIALVSLQAQLGASEYRPHFPYMNRNVGGHIPVTDGSLVVSNGMVNIAASFLSLSNTVPVPYARDCAPEPSCPNPATIGAQVLRFAAQGNQLNFTPDGGLFAFGSISPTNLTWGFIGGGNYAQRTSDVQDGAYHIPGTFLRANQTSVTNSLRPAVLLFTGRGNATNSTYVERPGMTVYRDGFANYAGLNFRAPTHGRSFIAGQDSGLYPLTSRSKYYVRFGGVSGIHESATFPANLTLYGYPFTFQSYRLSYLDSDNRDSRTDGAVALPHPSAFNVEFERMKFLCRGNLDSARLPATIGTKHLAYWNVDIKPMSLQFKPRAGNGCSLTERYLVLGVETKLPFIPQALHATLAFKTNGNLATAATQVEGVSGRFPVPANLSLQGPGGSVYPLTTAAEGYFNNWETPGRPNEGFYNLAGRVRVPFFRDIKVHLHVTPTGPSAAQIALMGGWPAEEGMGANRGWRDGTKDYFNTRGFDASHHGWPITQAAAVTQYRNSATEQFRARAQRNWIDVAIFDYPLAWNAVLREFNGFADARVVLPVIDVNSRLKQITPGKVDLDFAQDINLQLPRIKVLDFANDALNELNAPIHSISNAIRAQLGAALNTAGLTSGFRSLQTALRENAEGFFRPVLEPALDPVVNNLYSALATELAVNKANLLSKTPAIVSAGSNGLQSAMMNLNGAAGDVNKIVGQLNRTLVDADDTLGLFIRVLEKDGAGQRHVVRAIVQKLAGDQGPALGFVANLGDGLVNGLLGDLEPTLAKIESEMRQLRLQLNQLRAPLAAASGDFAAALNAANQNSAALQQYLQLAGAGMSNLLSTAVGPAGDFFIADPARARREIRERLIVAFLSSQMSASYQATFRDFLYDKNFLLNQLMNVLFDQVNRSIRNGLAEQLAGAQDGIFQNMKGAGAMSGSLLSAKIRGSPTFEGDSLRKIHLDSEIKMNLPDEMKFTAYMIIKELNSATTPISCIPPGAPAAEVTLGAKEVPLDWLGVLPGGPLKLNVEARWTLQSGAVLGVGGAFEVKGKVGFKGMSINDFGASLAIGQTENYFAAKAGATVTILGIPVNFWSGIFAGHACSVEPLKFIDPEAEQVLIVNVADFTGIYLQFGGGLSLSDILFGTSSCLLDIGANVNAALYYQGGPRLGSIGGRQKIGVNVDLICVISASAEWAVGMRLDSVGKLTVQGSARLCGKVGWCPACIKGCKTLTVTGVVTDGGIDYDVDF